MYLVHYSGTTTLSVFMSEGFLEDFLLDLSNASDKSPRPTFF